ncbi:GNAT family N-acetyltransferase [Puniceibacterium sediminis]|uniref:Ribosomal protein S18 acetylase RimI n=1 Tax=Puniceibacterium sediminis TaxID=1608407 RepID=A0A238WE65_9RHOB|nr:GNAT family N-acetyltransferase [Puniceibacterium sediminis]SNR43959.1 Ribosomal protein S18 acetylase RimI [Puniceibacterium sediminis]
MNNFPPTDRVSRFGVSYRDMTDADMPFLSRLYRSTREEEMSGLPWSDEQKQSFIDMQFRAQHEHYQKHYTDALWLIIEMNSAPIGRLYIERWASELRIIDIALIPDARGKGIGADILEDLQSEAAATAKNIGIHVEKANPAMSLYHRLGFKQTEDKGVYDLLVWRPAETGHCRR